MATLVNLLTIRITRLKIWVEHLRQIFFADAYAYIFDIDSDFNKFSFFRNSVYLYKNDAVARGKFNSIL